MIYCTDKNKKGDGFVTAVRGARDFTKGPIFFPMLLFALPVVAAGCLQMFYNTADKIVVGQFSGNEYALGAIGCTGSLYSLITALCTGLSVGAGVTVAHRFGAHEERALSRAVHTAFSVALIVGLLISVIGFVFCPTFLRWMGTDEKLFLLAVKYMRIVFAGTPFSILYNFGASVMRSVGNSRAPLVILAFSGLLNVGFNLLFVLGFGMSADGVAYGTVIAQAVSAFAVWMLLYRRTDSVRFRFRQLCIDRRALMDTVRIGIPSGFQASLFAISNVLLSSTVNTFPTTTVEGNAIGMSLSSYSSQASTGVYQAVLTFTGQNAGARRPDRVRRVLFAGLVQAALIVGMIGFGTYLFSDGLTSLFVDGARADAVLVAAAVKERCSVVLTCYAMCGVMEVLTAHLRGRKYSFVPMVLSMVFACFFRIFWMLVVFPYLPKSLFSLFLCYPISWAATATAQLIVICIINRRERRELLRTARAVP